MHYLYRALALYMLTIAVAVGVHYIITPLYDDGSTGFPVWNILNWPMAVGVALAFAFNLFYWLQQAAEGFENLTTIRWLQTNIRFYSSLVLLLWFFNNWFADLLGLDTAVQWTFVNVLFVAVMISTGSHPWQQRR